jgi:hypothetical protein
MMSGLEFSISGERATSLSSNHQGITHDYNEPRVLKVVVIVFLLSSIMCGG